MRNNGWIRLHRKITNSDMYCSLTATQRDVLIQCLLMANHKPSEWIYKGQLYRCDPGQFKTSLEELKKRCALGTTVKQLRGTLDKLRIWGFLASEGTKTGRVITILNWKVYQDDYYNKGQTEGQTKGRRRASNKNDKEEYSPNCGEVRMSELLVSLIRQSHPKYKTPNIQRWAVHIDRMIRLDNRSLSDIEAVIRWSQADQFWKKNILSTEKLREKFDNLWLKAGLNEKPREIYC